MEKIPRMPLTEKELDNRKKVIEAEKERVKEETDLQVKEGLETLANLLERVKGAPVAILEGERHAGTLRYDGVLTDANPREIEDRTLAYIDGYREDGDVNKSNDRYPVPMVVLDTDEVKLIEDNWYQYYEDLLGNSKLSSAYEEPVSYDGTRERDHANDYYTIFGKPCTLSAYDRFQKESKILIDRKTRELEIDQRPRLPEEIMEKVLGKLNAKWEELKSSQNINDSDDIQALVIAYHKGEPDGLSEKIRALRDFAELVCDVFFQIGLSPNQFDRLDIPYGYMLKLFRPGYKIPYPR